MSQLVLVTGAAGFLGANLCRRLVDGGDRVVGLDNLQTGTLARLGDLLDHPAFRFVEHDVTAPFDVGPVERVYHLACPASPSHYQRDPVRTLFTSVLGTRHALDQASRAGARFLLASSSEVYGDPEVHPQPETYRGHVSPIGPRACYDEGKRAAEALTWDVGRTRGLPVRIGRLFNTYGPGLAVDDGRVVANFVTQALRGEALTLYGDGGQTRSLCYVEDLLDGLVALMEAPRVPGPINLGSDDERTVREIAEAVLAAVGSGRIVHRPLPDDDPRRRCPDLTRARDLLGFAPRWSLAAGMVPTVAWFRAQLAPPRGAACSTP